MLNDRAAIEQLLKDAGWAINANDGRCHLIEDVLCRVTAICTELLAQETGQEHSERMHRENDPHVIGDDEVCRGPSEDYDPAEDDGSDPDECPHCNGTGEQTSGGLSMECPECGGDGWEC